MEDPETFAVEEPAPPVSWDSPEGDAPPISWDSPEGDAVRAERTDRLLASDWKVLPDSPHQRSLMTRGALWLYRDALRNITKSCASPVDVVWPVLTGV
jgi:hypothetical protein